MKEEEEEREEGEEEAEKEGGRRGGAEVEPDGRKRGEIREAWFVCGERSGKSPRKSLEERWQKRCMISGSLCPSGFVEVELHELCNITCTSLVMMGQ